MFNYGKPNKAFRNQLHLCIDLEFHRRKFLFKKIQVIATCNISMYIHIYSVHSKIITKYISNRIELFCALAHH